MQQIWEMPGTASVLLEEVAISPTIEQPSRQLTNCRTIIPNKFLHCCKVPRATVDSPTWGIPAKGLRTPREFDFEGQWDLINRASTGLGKQTLGGHEQNLACSRNQEDRAVMPREAETDLPVSVQEFPEEFGLTVAFNGIRGNQ